MCEGREGERGERERERGGRDRESIHKINHKGSLSHAYSHAIRFKKRFIFLVSSVTITPG